MGIYGCSWCFNNIYSKKDDDGQNNYYHNSRDNRDNPSLMLTGVYFHLPSPYDCKFQELLNNSNPTPEKRAAVIVSCALAC